MLQLNVTDFPQEQLLSFGNLVLFGNFIPGANTVFFFFFSPDMTEESKSKGRYSFLSCQDSEIQCQHKSVCAQAAFLVNDSKRSESLHFAVSLKSSIPYTDLANLCDSRDPSMRGAVFTFIHN